jgi:hypothetical protein
MLRTGDLGQAFKIYWDDIDRCRRAEAYWSLLHVTICLPDICGALQSASGEAKPRLYIAWCDLYFSDPRLTGSEHYLMRCKVLHQGRAKTNRCRYGAFAFGQPAQSGAVDHMRLDAHHTLHLDVGELATETTDAVEKWIKRLEAKPTSDEALNVTKNLESLVRVTPFVVSQPTGSTVTMYKTN